MTTPVNNKTIEDQLTLEYHGIPVKTGRMNSYEVAAYIIAFSEFLGIVSNKTYGEKITIKTEIQGFRKDSFDIDFFFQLGVVTGMLFNETPFSVRQYAELVKECIKVWLHLNGESPKSIQPVQDNRNNLQIENQNGTILYTSINVTNIISDPKAGEAVEQFIKKPLEAGLSHVRINSKSSGEIARLEKKDALSFVPIPIERPSAIEKQQEIQITLLIESATFKEGNKWRFSDGENSFAAAIIDEEFLKNVNEGVARFGKGDQLIARVRFTQSGAFGSLKLDRTIVKVLEHKIPPRTGRLFRLDPSDK